MKKIISIVTLLHVFVISERLIGLPDSMLKNHNRPQVVPALEGVFIEDIAVGCEHILALSNTGDVYAWGCNCEAQVHKHTPVCHTGKYTHIHSSIVTVSLCVCTVGSRSLKSSEGTHSGHGSTRQKHQTDLGWSMPQRCVDNATLVIQGLRYARARTHTFLQSSTDYKQNNTQSRVWQFSCLLYVLFALTLLLKEG